MTQVETQWNNRMKMPTQAVPVLRGYIHAAHIGQLLQQQLDCGLCCLPKAGFGACVARCIVDGQACDGGTTNCSQC